MVADMILGTGYMDENIKKVSAEKDTLKPAGSSPDEIEESIDNAAYIAYNVETKHGNEEKECSEYACTAVYQRVIPPLSEACLYVRSTAQGVQLATLYKNFVGKYQALRA